MGSGMLPIELMVHGAAALEGLVGGNRAAVLDAGAAEAQADQPVVLDEQPVGHAQRLELEAVLLHGLGEQLARGCSRTFCVALGRRAFGDLDQRHVLDARGGRRACSPRARGPRRRGRGAARIFGMPFTSSSIRSISMPRSRSFARVVSSISAFATSIEARPPPITRAPSCGSNTGPVVAGFFRVVEPDDEGVLVDEPLADVGVGALDGQRPVAPGAVGEHDAGEAPVARRARGNPTSRPMRVQGHEVDAGLRRGCSRIVAYSFWRSAACQRGSPSSIFP